MPLLRAMKRRKTTLLWPSAHEAHQQQSTVERVESCSDHFFSTTMTSVEERIGNTFTTYVRNAVAAKQTERSELWKTKEVSQENGWYHEVRKK